MKLLLLSVLIIVGFSACASKKHNPYSSHESAIKASEKAHKELANDTK